MCSLISRVLRSWRVLLGALLVAGWLLGAPFTGGPGSQAAAKGHGGHHSHKPKGKHARIKRHGPRRHHARHHAAKRHRHHKLREHHVSHGHSRSGKYVTDRHVTDRHVTIGPGYVHNRWNYWGWGNHFDRPDVVVGPGPVVVPGPQKVFIAIFEAPVNGKDRSEQILALTAEEVRATVFDEYPSAVIKRIELKYVAIFNAPADGKDHTEQIFALTPGEVKEKVLHEYPGAVIKSVKVMLVSP
jgi:hypothetical protein